MIPTKEEILRAIDTIAEYAPISGYSCPGKRIKNALRILVERADDVDRLVEAAKEATTIIHAKTADDQTEYKIAGAEIKLRAALVPFDVPIFNEEGHSNEEKQSRKIREGPHEDADDTGEK